MRILHVLDHSAPLQSGYVFRTQGILRAQRARGWETVHLTTCRHRRDGPDPETVDGLTYHRTRLPRSPLLRLPVARETLEMRATEARLLALARQARPDVIHAHSPVLNAIPALRVGRRLGLPVVYEVRAFWEDAAASEGQSAPGGLRYGATKWLETRALWRADAVTTICNGLRDDMLARGLPADRVTVIPNAVDAARFTPIAEKDAALVARYDLAGCTVLGFIGSFYRYEGLDLLVRAMAGLAARHATLRLLLVGGGPEAERIGALVAELGLAHSVILTGRVPHEEVGRYYSVIDAFVYPRQPMRLTELVTPLKPLESMAMEKLVIASDVGGHRELIADGRTGFLFKAGDADSLAAVIARVIDGRIPWADILRAGRQYVETERAWPRVVERYAPLYDRLVGAAVA